MALVLKLELARDSFVWGEPVPVAAVLGLDGSEGQRVTDLDPSQMIWELGIPGEVEPKMFRPAPVLPCDETFELTEGDELGCRLDVHRWLGGPGRFELRCTYTEVEPAVRSETISFTVDPCAVVVGAPLLVTGAKDLASLPGFALLRGDAGASLMSLVVGEMEDDAHEPLAILTTETVARLPADTDQLVTMRARTAEFEQRTMFTAWRAGASIGCGVGLHGFVTLEHEVPDATGVVAPVLSPAPATADVLALAGRRLHRIRFGPLEIQDAPPPAGGEDDEVPIDPTTHVRKPAPSLLASVDLPETPVHAGCAVVGDLIAVALTAQTDEGPTLLLGIGAPDALPGTWTEVPLGADLTAGTIATFVDNRQHTVVIVPGVNNDGDEPQLVAMAHAFDTEGRSVVAPGCGYDVIATLDAPVREASASAFVSAEGVWRCDVAAVLEDSRCVGRAAGLDFDRALLGPHASPLRLLSTETYACFASVHPRSGAVAFTRV